MNDTLPLIPEVDTTKSHPGPRRQCVRVASVLTVSIFVLSFIASASYLTLRQLSLEKDLQNLRSSLAAVQRARRDVMMTEATLASDHQVHKRRHIRAAINKERKQRKNKNVSAHYEAYIDEELLARQHANGLPTVGEITGNGFKPNDQIYRIWKASNWTNNKIYSYDASTGKVQVKKTGTYLIYGQVLFHGPTARKSFGIHVNDETKPVVESIAYNVMPTGSEIPMRYNQCNTNVVVQIDAGSQVFLKSLERGRTFIAQRSLTYWGITKLN